LLIASPLFYVRHRNQIDLKNRANIKKGSRVKVVQKQDQRSEKLTEGTVKDILTNSSTHPNGIKVRLESGIVGRVKEVVADRS
jgi:uncharacterized repeat protein (TIGR03833 family)